MYCPSCGSECFGTALNLAGEIVRLCGDCGYAEEASPSEVALFMEDNALMEETV